MLDDWDAEESAEFKGKFEDLIQENVTIASSIRVKPVVTKVKNKKQIMLEHIERKNNELELTPDQIRSRKEEEERLLRESDFSNAVDLFGLQQRVDVAQQCKNLNSGEIRNMIDTLTIIMNNKIKEEKNNKFNTKKPVKTWTKGHDDITHDDFM